MPTIGDLLVPLDGSRSAETSLVHARSLARASGARVHLLRVVPAATPDAPQDPVGWRLDRSDAGAYLRGIADRLRRDGIEVETDVAAGRPDEEIVARARRAGAEVVIITPTGAGRARGAPMGGTAHKVVHRIGTSVLMARPVGGEEGRSDAAVPAPERGDRYRELLVPVDASPASEWALHTAASLLPDAGGTLVAACVLAGDEADPPGSAARPRDREPRAPGSDRGEARAFLSRARRRLEREGLGVETLLLPATHVARRLHDLADERDADLVVVSAHGRSGEAPWPYGSVAVNLLLHGRRPTLILQDQMESRRAEPPAGREPLRPGRERPRVPEEPGGARDTTERPR